MQRWWKILIAAGKGWSDDNAFHHSAAVSFYMLFFLAPVAIIAVGLGGMLLGQATAARQFYEDVSQLVGPEGAKIIETAMTTAQARHHGWASSATGIAVLLAGATSVFGQLQDSLNEIWGVKARPGRQGLAFLLLRRLVSFGMVLSVGFLLLVSLVITAFLEAAVRSANGQLTVSPAVLRSVDLAVALVVITALFAAFFKILPDVELPWSAVWASAFFTSALFSVGKVLIATYLAHSTVASIYGAAGSLVALLVWIYYSCAIMFFGVEITRADRRERGLPVKPKKNAVPISQ